MEQDQLPLGKKNYIFIAIGIAVILLGFLLMATEGFIDSSQFSLSLYVSPVLIIGGFAWIIYAILAEDKSTTNS